jgi:hypothetical protein
MATEHKEEMQLMFASLELVQMPESQGVYHNKKIYIYSI